MTKTKVNAPNKKRGFDLAFFLYDYKRTVVADKTFSVAKIGNNAADLANMH